ncbi:MAG: PAS domain-containing sensor histidine kinase [Bdellovibrionales bacterium]|nr:PAS domain-containing sensor histidine kinase [Bdellovibrionales bacterium]
MTQLQHPVFTAEPLLLIIEGSKTHSAKIEALLSEVRDKKFQTQVIFFNCQLPQEKLVELFNIIKPLSITFKNDPTELEKNINRAFETVRELQQTKSLVELFNDQNKELKKISVDLEAKIEKRQAHLQEAKQKLSVTNKKNMFLHKCLLAIHSAETISDLEVIVTSNLRESMNLSWFKIEFSYNVSEMSVEKNPYLSSYRIPILRDQIKYGDLVFAREGKDMEPFKKEEKQLLNLLGEGIILSVDKLLQIEKNNELQYQWQSTFNAISDPVCLIDENYNLTSANQTFLQRSGLRSIEGVKCYEALFKRTSPCVDCHRGNHFRLRDQQDSSHMYDVFSQTMQIDYQKNYFHLYRDISRQLGLERQIVESAKMAELGTIGSSIAHELNNPLGGMLNFIQLIRMDLSKDDPLYEDIIEMEKGALKCKDIVQNLLNFTRHGSLGEAQDLSLIEVVHRAILITELRTRALGIKIDLQWPEEKIMVHGRFNPLAQAICNVLQNAYEAILTRRKKEETFPGTISVNLREEASGYTLRIIDDGAGLDEKIVHQIFDPLFSTKDPDRHSGLGLTLAQQILSEHQGLLVVTPQKDGKTCFCLCFPRIG